ncbi:hypothetical protein PR048_032856 [Dryococelus australis]|uniref:DDE-1 domain-containing protein n=1 Tax=Dryococelus australis TaxID=614101 RepID=A0ABQ9G3F0_9NEOP|nr:hypothetical protein PR048_032856 [Dryococelus australis]
MAGFKVSEIVIIFSRVAYVTVDEWKQKLASLIQEYQPRDVFNSDETGLFLRTLAECQEKCITGKKAKERISVFICGNMVDNLEKLLVVGKVATTRSFKGHDLDSLPEQWKSNKKRWMTAAITEE